MRKSEVVSFQCKECWLGSGNCIINIEYINGYRKYSKDPKRCPFKGGNIKAKWEKVA